MLAGMREALKLVMAVAAVAASPAGAEILVADKMATEPELLLARAREEGAIKSDTMRRDYRTDDDMGRWDVDLDAGTITFTSAHKVATAPVQVVGTYNTGDGTFLWGWDHPSVPAHAAEAAKAVKAYGDRHDIKNITTRKVAVTEEEAWDFTAMAAYLTDAKGLYRGPSGPTHVFMTFGPVKVSKP